MIVSTLNIFCGEQHKENEAPRAEVHNHDGYVTLDIGFKEGAHQKITLFMGEKDLINFKNSVVNAVNNYKKGKPELSAEAILKREA